MPSTLRNRRADDPTLDDWFREQGEIEWTDEQEPADGERRTASEFRTAAPLSGSHARRVAAVRRRRVIGLVALLALTLVGVAAALTVFGSDEPAAPTTAPAATTQPPATQPPAATTQPPAETTSPLTIELPTTGPLGVGARGDEVETLQTALRALRFDPGAVDGVFGEGTREAVRAFQRANDLPADGIVGSATAERLNSVLAERGITG